MGRYSWGWNLLPIADGAQAQLVVEFDDGTGWTPIFTAVTGPLWEGGVEALVRDPDGYGDHERTRRRAQRVDLQTRIPRAIARHHMDREPTDDEVVAVAYLTWGRALATLVDAVSVAAALSATTGATS